MQTLTTAVDWLAAPFDRVMGILPSEVAAKVGLPLFAVALVLVTALLVRKGIVWASKLIDRVLRGVATGLAWGALTALVLPTLPWRAKRGPVPALIYNADDFIAGATAWALDGIRYLTTGFAKLAKMNLFLVFLLSAVLFYGWNEGHCGAESEFCAKPVDVWISALSD